MKKLSIMLCCGAGMSSGFLAQKTRKEAKKRGIIAKIEARSESEATQYFPEIDLLLLGPHYASYKEELTDIAKPYGVPVEVIPQDIYGKLDGGKLLDLALGLVQNKETE